MFRINQSCAVQNNLPQNKQSKPAQASSHNNVTMPSFTGNAHATAYGQAQVQMNKNVKFGTRGSNEYRRLVDNSNLFAPRMQQVYRGQGEPLMRNGEPVMVYRHSPNNPGNETLKEKFESMGEHNRQMQESRRDWASRSREDDSYGH